MLLASSPERLDGAGDSYHVSGRAWRNGHGERRKCWAGEDAEVFAPCAAAALYRRHAFDEVGGFDEQYFCYFEDVDLGFRLRLRGHNCLYIHSAIVEHVSSALSGYRSDFAVYHGERNAVWTFFKNMPSALLWLYLPQHLLLNVAALMYYPGEARVQWYQGEVRCPAGPSRRSSEKEAGSTIAAGERMDTEDRDAARNPVAIPFTVRGTAWQELHRAQKR